MLGFLSSAWHAFGPWCLLLSTPGKKTVPWKELGFGAPQTWLWGQVITDLLRQDGGWGLFCLKLVIIPLQWFELEISSIIGTKPLWGHDHPVLGLERFHDSLIWDRTCSGTRKCQGFASFCFLSLTLGSGFLICSDSIMNFHFRPSPFLFYFAQMSPCLLLKFEVRIWYE